MKISWDKYETALLIDTYWKIENGNIARKDAITALSVQLRQRAINNGIEIDDIFRNENGIALQLSTLEYIFTKGERGLQKQPTKIFVDIAELYNNSRNEFEILLFEALVTNKDMSNKELFTKWLFTKIGYKLIPSYIDAIDEISIFCINKKIIHNALFESTDANDIVNSRKTVQNNKLFKITHKKTIATADVAIKRYYEFICEINKINAEYLSTTIIIEESSSDVIQDTLLVDFSMPSTFVFTKPLFFTYFDEITVTVKSWRELLLEFSKVIYEDYPQIIDSIVNGNFNNTDTPFITNKKEKSLLKVPGKFTENLYIDLNGSAYDIVLKIRFLLDACNVDYENLVIKYCSKMEYQAKKIEELTFSTEHKKSFTKTSNHIETCKETIKAILCSHYNYGIKIDSPIEIMRFRRYYYEKNQKECLLKDEELISAIKKCGFEFENKIYVITKETKDKIFEKLCSYTEAGMGIFYYEDLYKNNENWLYEERVLSSEMLKNLLMSIFPKYQYKTAYFITTTKQYSETNFLKDELLKFWGNQTLQTYDTLSEKLPFVPLEKIKYATAQHDCFIWNSVETYTRIDYFRISENEKEDILNTARRICTENGSVNFDNLPLEAISAENFELSESAFFSIIYSFLSDEFDRNGRVLTKKGEQHDTYTEIYQYCKQKESCTEDELEQLMKSISGIVRHPVIIEAANAAMVRVDYNKYVSEDLVDFDSAAIDSVLEYLIIDDAIGMKEIISFSSFPHCGFAWNLFIVESFCRRFSEKFKYEAITPNSRNAGAIIKKNCGLDYHDIMIQSVAKHCMQLTESSVYDYLIEKGFIIRRQYTKINDLIEKAKSLREGGE